MDNKSDLYLVEAWRGEDQQDKERAGDALKNRFHQRLLGYVAQKVQYEFVDDVVQEIWETFFAYMLDKTCY